MYVCVHGVRACVVSFYIICVWDVYPLCFIMIIYIYISQHYPCSVGNGVIVAKGNRPVSSSLLILVKYIFIDSGLISQDDVFSSFLCVCVFRMICCKYSLGYKFRHNFQCALWDSFIDPCRASTVLFPFLLTSLSCCQCHMLVNIKTYAHICI